jgi:hypothetical protein
MSNGSWTLGAIVDCGTARVCRFGANVLIPMPGPEEGEGPSLAVGKDEILVFMRKNPLKRKLLYGIS